MSLLAAAGGGCRPSGLRWARPPWAPPRVFGGQPPERIEHVLSGCNSKANFRNPQSLVQRRVDGRRALRCYCRMSAKPLIKYLVSTLDLMERAQFSEQIVKMGVLAL